MYENAGTTISTCVIRAGQSAQNYRERATEIKRLKNELTELTRQLAAAKKSLTFQQKHQDSIKEYRRAALDALEQRNVARDKLKAMQRERDRWQAKYVYACALCLLVV